VVLSWEKDQSMVQLPVYLENLSLYGCLVKSKTCPALQCGDPVWFGLPGTERADWTEGILVTSRKAFLGRCSISIRFLTPLPYLTFKHLVVGPEPGEKERFDAPDYEKDQFWR
jgi:hypothetical protein